MGKNVSEIERGAGYFEGVITGMMDIVREKAVPFAAIYRLATAGGRTTLGKIVDLAYIDWQAEQPQQADVGQPQGGQPYRDAPTNDDSLPVNHYRVRVTYAPIPSLAALKQEFGKGNVSDIFDGRAWELHSSCVGMSRTPGERIFYVHDVGRDWEREEQIAWGLQQRTAIAPSGYRPATHDEEYEFQKAHPELLDYVTLGSSTLFGGLRYVARVWSHGGRRVLGLDWIDFRFDARHRVLFVSK